MGDNYDQDKEINNAFLTSCGGLEYGIKVNKFKQKMFSAVLKAITSLKPESESILDIGSSYGGFLLMAKDNGFKVKGTDIVPEAVDFMRSNNIDAIQCFSVKELGSDDKYDIVSALDCNMYFPDQPQEIQAMRELLNKDGLLVIRVVDKSWIIKIGLLCKKFSKALGNKIIQKGINDHRFSMPIKSFIRLVKNKNLDIIKFSIKDAQHSVDSGTLVKFSFFLGNIIYSLTGFFFAPGALIILKDKNASA